MAGSLKLHWVHGVNPTIPVCYFCGQDKKEVALLGAAYKGQAPMNMVIDQEPCDDCKSWMKKGVILIQVEDNSEPPHPVRTGGFCVISEAGIRKMFTDEAATDLLEKRAGFLEQSLWEDVGIPAGD